MKSTAAALGIALPKILMEPAAALRRMRDTALHGGLGERIPGYSLNYVSVDGG